MKKKKNDGSKEMHQKGPTLLFAFVMSFTDFRAK